jgi:hypothetical protein
MEGQKYKNNIKERSRLSVLLYPQFRSTFFYGLKEKVFAYPKDSISDGTKIQARK